MMEPQHHTLTTNAHAGGRTRYATLHGRRYMVVPVVMLAPGVHAGSDGPLYYPPEELAKTPEAWNTKPVVVYHPQHGTATAPEVLERQAVGTVMNAKWAGGKLRAEVWLDAGRLENLAPEVGRALAAGSPVEVSTGLYTDQAATPGSYLGKPYGHVATNHRPDHLALLPVGKGACSVADGCGLLLTNEETQMTNDMQTPQGDEEPLVAPVMNFDRGAVAATTPPTILVAVDDDSDEAPLVPPVMNFSGSGEDVLVPRVITVPRVRYGKSLYGEAPVANECDEAPLVAPVMNFGEVGCGCGATTVPLAGGGGVAAPTAPQPWPAPQAGPPVGNAAAAACGADDAPLLPPPSI